MFFLRLSKVLVDYSTLELSRGAALQATTFEASVRGSDVTGFPRWRTPSIVQGEVYLTSTRRDHLDRMIDCSRPDVILKTTAGRHDIAIV